MLLLQKLRPKVKYGTLQCSRKTVYSDRKNYNSKKQQQKTTFYVGLLIFCLCVFFIISTISTYCSLFFFGGGKHLIKATYITLLNSKFTL